MLKTHPIVHQLIEKRLENIQTKTPNKFSYCHVWSEHSGIKKFRPACQPYQEASELITRNEVLN